MPSTGLSTYLQGRWKIFFSHDESESIIYQRFSDGQRFYVRKMVSAFLISKNQILYAAKQKTMEKANR